MDNLNFAEYYTGLLKKHNLIAISQEFCEKLIKSWACENPDESADWDINQINIQLTNQGCYFDSQDFNVPNIELTWSIELSNRYFGRYIYQCDLDGEFLNEYLTVD